MYFCKAPENWGWTMKPNPSNMIFDVIISPNPRGAWQAISKQHGHYSYHDSKKSGYFQSVVPHNFRWSN